MTKKVICYPVNFNPAIMVIPAISLPPALPVAETIKDARNKNDMQNRVHVPRLCGNDMCCGDL